MPDPVIDVSVIIPTYNRSTILRRTLDLYCQQQGMDGRFEVIVGDDGSADDTSKMLTAAEASSPFPLRHISLIMNNGPSVARNRAIALAKGKILLFTSDDMLPTPRFVAEHYEWHMQHQPGVNIGLLGYVQWAPELEITPFMRWLEQSGTQFAYGRMTHGEQIDCGLLHTSNVSFKSEFLKTANEFLDERLHFHEDSEWALRLQRRGLELRYNANAISDHLHPVDLDASLARMQAVGRSLAQLKSISPENFRRATHGLLEEKTGAFKKVLLLLVDPLLGKLIYAPLARLCQRHFIIDRLFAACHASYLLGGIREGLRRPPQSTRAEAGNPA